MKPVKHHKDMELRGRSFEVRAADIEGRTIEGYAAVFDSPTDMGWYTEQIASGAFDGADMSDVPCLFNHDPNQVLARSSAGSLDLTTDEKGLKFRFTFGDASHDEDVYKMVKDGRISKCSFGFVVESQTWTETEGQPDLRSITKIATVFDVSLVTYPAYNDTSVALRSKPQASENEETEQEKETIHSPEFREDVAFYNQRLSAV